MTTVIKKQLTKSHKSETLTIFFCNSKTCFCQVLYITYLHTVCKVYCTANLLLIQLTHQAGTIETKELKIKKIVPYLKKITNFENIFSQLCHDKSLTSLNNLPRYKNSRRSFLHYSCICQSRCPKIMLQDCMSHVEKSMPLQKVSCDVDCSVQTWIIKNRSI